MEDLYSMDNVKPSFKCAACSKSFFVKSHLSDHLYSHIKGKFLINMICRKGFSEISELNEYFREYMQTNAWICDVCKTAFFAKSDFLKHQSVHIQEYCSSYYCKICIKKFKDVESLCAHIHEDHTDLFICELCGKTFSLKQNLNRHHSKVHAIPKSFTCTVCDEQFSQYEALINHRQLHKKSKSLYCELCDKQFDKSSRLKSHLYKHKKGKPFSCR